MTLNEQNKLMDQETKPLRILIADDDPPTRILLRAAISQWGYEVIEATDGEEVWQILKQPDPPPLLILDWIMPKIDGLDLCKRIHSELASTYHPYIILLSQMTGTENIIKGLEAGANEFLSKPFNMAELRSRLSVGRTIIKYQKTVSEQCKQLQDNISRIEIIKNLVVSCSKMTNEIIKSSNTQNDKTNNIDKLQKFNEIRISLENIMDVCNKFHPESKDKD